MTPVEQRSAQDPNSAPGYLWFGIAAVFVALAIVIGLCMWLKLGVLWLLFAAVLASFMFMLIPVLPHPWGTVLFLVVPPVTGALFLKPKVPQE